MNHIQIIIFEYIKQDIQFTQNWQGLTINNFRGYQAGMIIVPGIDVKAKVKAKIIYRQQI